MLRHKTGIRKTERKVGIRHLTPGRNLMETAISTTRLHSLSGSLPSLAGIFIIPPVVHSFIMLCHAPLILLPRMPFLSHEKTDRLMRAFPGRLPSSTVCNLLDSPVLGSMHIQSKKNTNNKQQPGQLFSSSYGFFPAKFHIFYFSLLFPTYLLGLWSIVVISPGLTTRCCSGRSVLAKVWFDDGEVVSQSVTNE